MATSNCNNCGCKKCGCQDDFLTTPPACPTPIGCPTPEPCSEIIDAECVIYTGLPIMCGLDEVVDTDTTLADALTDTITYFCANGGGSTNIGKRLGGGIVVAEWDENGVHKGLIASLTTLSGGIQWTVPAQQTTLIGPTAQSFSDGFTNTNAIITQTGVPAANTYAAGLARLHNGGGYTDWYLPSLQELNMCYNSITVIDRVLGFNNFSGSGYWSSTEFDATTTFFYITSIGNAQNSNKSVSYAVRAVRIHNI